MWAKSDLGQARSSLGHSPICTLCVEKCGSRRKVMKVGSVRRWVSIEKHDAHRRTGKQARPIRGWGSIQEGEKKKMASRDRAAKNTVEGLENWRDTR